MSEVTIRAKKDPYYSQNDKVQLKIKSFGVETFLIQRDDMNGDKARYEKFMHSLFPYTPDSKIELNPSGGDPRKFSWTKEGDLLVYIEYIEWEDDDTSVSADKKRY